ncbi:hypothetical protein RVR_8313 [Actinacidiphila reveromycinica]|uniref:Lsr2 DNA-binding domain-containing protein n=1 Tax=Actinacidiphila reveromycinica TaxID=659352 RepID=A0A7U3UYI8_9ACTN|nr:histone-like nucleoid-structuring protein Lsr2 [Streptomyces sp. SN-593]BBB01070.1 hypothetical protein RVR_8313 [Streptomyces sp. SN-593]
MAGDILVARRTAAVVWQGRQIVLQAGETFARAGHPILDVYGAEFEPITVHFDTDGVEEALKPQKEAVKVPKAATGDEGDDSKPTASEPASAAAQPAAKDVRAWAKDNSVEVPARGAIPEDVMAQYVAAHAEA